MRFVNNFLTFAVCSAAALALVPSNTSGISLRAKTANATAENTVDVSLLSNELDSAVNLALKLRSPEQIRLDNEISKEAEKAIADHDASLISQKIEQRRKTRSPQQKDLDLKIDQVIEKLQREIPVDLLQQAGETSGSPKETLASKADRSLQTRAIPVVVGMGIIAKAALGYLAKAAAAGLSSKAVGGAITGAIISKVV